MLRPLFGEDVFLHFGAFRVGLVVQDVARDTFQDFADLVERREPDGRTLSAYRRADRPVRSNRHKSGQVVHA